jgi:hypothetical protein
MILSASSAEISAPDRSLPEELRAIHSPEPGELERPIPAAPWGRVLSVTVAIALLLMVAWEIEMRRLGLRAGDLDDGRGQWAVERHKVDAGPRDSLVIIGDSRILFDTDLATWQKLTGRRPIQLALMGANALPILDDLAADEHFAGLLVIGTAEFSYFSHAGSASSTLKYVRNESPSQRIGQRIHKTLSQYLAFLDSHYTLFALLEQHKMPERKDVDSPYMDVWKISEAYEDRQSYSWERLERDEYLRRHAESVWLELFPGPAATPEEVGRVIMKTRADIEQIRARGGEVIWVRPPSNGPVLEIERARYPRRQVWDRLMRDTASFGIYFEDYPAMRDLRCLDSSHLSRASAIAFTNAYVRVFLDRVERLKSR